MNMFYLYFISFKGHDPTASALSFALYTLSRHPEIQQKVYEEQKVVLKGKKSIELKNCKATLEELEHMSYLELVLRETLRLYPSVPLIARTNRNAIDISKFILFLTI